MVKSFLLKNANQHVYKLVRATEDKMPHADERAKIKLSKKAMSSLALRGHLVSLERLITEDKPLTLTTVFQHDSFDLHFFVNGLLNFS